MVSASATTLSVARRSIVVAARPQLAVMSGQLVAGLGNLLYAVILAHVLDPGDYADVVAFLAVYVLMHVPAAAFSAAGSLAPDRVDRLTPRIAVIGLITGLSIALMSGWIGELAGIDRALVLALAAAAPAAALLGLRRGVAYGHEQLGRVSASLVSEPAMRLGVGVVLALIAGPIGAAVGAVLAGYTALAVSRPRRDPPRRCARPCQRASPRPSAGHSC